MTADDAFDYVRSHPLWRQFTELGEALVRAPDDPRLKVRAKITFEAIMELYADRRYASPASW
jgi:hypothetical protein